MHEAGSGDEDNATNKTTAHLQQRPRRYYSITDRLIKHACASQPAHLRSCSSRAYTAMQIHPGLKRSALSNFEKGGFDPTLKFEPGGFSAHFGLVARRIASTYGRYASLGRV